MDNTPHDQPDPARQRQPEILRHAAEALREMLPAPQENTPEGWAERDRLALAIVASLLPATLVEADLAAHHVAATAHACECLRQAAHHRANPQLAGVLRAQAATFGREARSYQSMLLRVQAVRRKRHANEAFRAADAATEQRVYRLMMEALESLPPPRPRPPAPQANPAAPPRQATLALQANPPAPPRHPAPAPQVSPPAPPPQSVRPRDPGPRRNDIMPLSHYIPHKTIH
jgi:hypothetical protein